MRFAILLSILILVFDIANAQREEILLIPNINSLFTNKTPEVFAQETRSAGFDLKSGKKLEDELLNIKRDFANKNILTGYGYSRKNITEKISDKASKLLSEIDALENLMTTIGKVKIFQNYDSSEIYSKCKICVDSLYKLELSNNYNEFYTLFIILPKDTIVNTSCLNAMKGFSNQIFKNNNITQSYKSETLIYFSNFDRSIRLKSFQKDKEDGFSIDEKDINGYYKLIKKDDVISEKYTNNNY